MPETQQQDPQSQTYSGRAKKYYNDQYESWYPWIEDQYLKWFTKDNKASYATKDTLSKTKVTGIDQVDNLQDGVNNAVGSQVGKGGLLQPVGDMASKEGINRAERNGKDNKGEYTPGGAGDSYINQAKGGASAVGDGVGKGASSLGQGAKSAGSWVGGWGGKKEEGQQEK